MMLAALIASFVTITYSVPTQPVPYTLDLKFDGFVGILGLTNAKVELQANLDVKGDQPDSQGVSHAVTNLDDMKVILNGALLPFTKDNVSQYFPNTVTINADGKVLKSDSPDVKLPIHLPGLDIKHFPDLTFLAVEFPKDGIQAATPFTYTREYQAGPVSYTVTPRSITDGLVEIDLTMTQDYDEQQDEANEITKDPKDAVYDVKTHVQGSGTVEFDRKLGLIRKVHIDATAHADVTKLDTKAQSTRDLKTALDVALAQ